MAPAAAPYWLERSTLLSPDASDLAMLLAAAGGAGRTFKRSVASTRI